MRLLALPAILSVLTFTFAIPRSSHEPRPLPLLIWHGLGDRYDADGLHTVGDLAIAANPGTYVYYIHLDNDSSKDRSATFLGNVTDQINLVCAALQIDPKLRDPLNNFNIRVDALGFSQGGQFLRGLVQRCEPLHVRSLVTFGSQHTGVARIKECGRFDFVCQGALALIKNNMWTDYVQGRVVPAQYYRTLNETTGAPSDDYLAGSNFLADVNNERARKNDTYKAAIANLEKFVMYMFEHDTTVIPKESGWFADVNMTSGVVTPLRETTSYQEDWLGLKKLDEKGGLVFKTTRGDHMQLDMHVMETVFRKYFGPETEFRKHTFAPFRWLSWTGSVIIGWWLRLSFPYYPY